MKLVSSCFSFSVDLLSQISPEKYSCTPELQIVCMQVSNLNFQQTDTHLVANTQLIWSGLQDLL